jgi:Uma2 family endonuclease
MNLLEYFNTPETVLPQELIYGAVRVQDAPFVSHQRTVFRMAMALANRSPWTPGEVLIAPVDVVLDMDRALVLQPDIVWVDAARDQIVRERIYGPPDLAVEVLSPRPRIGDLTERVKLFLEYGVRELWLYHQTLARFDVLHNAGDGRVHERHYGLHEPIESVVLPGFAPTPSELTGQR